MASIHDERRTYYPDLESALAALPIAVARRAEVRTLVAAVDTQRRWIPGSWQYIALGPEQGPVAAYVNRTFVDVRRSDGGYDRSEMSDFVETAHGSPQASAGGADGVWGKQCPTCYLPMSLAGVCEDCA